MKLIIVDKQPKNEEEIQKIQTNLIAIQKAAGRSFSWIQFRLYVPGIKKKSRKTDKIYNQYLPKELSSISLFDKDTHFERYTRSSPEGVTFSSLLRDDFSAQKHYKPYTQDEIDTLNKSSIRKKKNSKKKRTNDSSITKLSTEASDAKGRSAEAATKDANAKRRSKKSSDAKRRLAKASGTQERSTKATNAKIIAEEKTETPAAKSASLTASSSTQGEDDSEAKSASLSRSSVVTEPSQEESKEETPISIASKTEAVAQSTVSGSQSAAQTAKGSTIVDDKNDTTIKTKFLINRFTGFKTDSNRLLDRLSALGGPDKVEAIFYNDETLLKPPSKFTKINNAGIIKAHTDLAKQSLDKFKQHLTVLGYRHKNYEHEDADSVANEENHASYTIDEPDDLLNSVDQIGFSTPALAGAGTQGDEGDAVLLASPGYRYQEAPEINDNVSVVSDLSEDIDFTRIEDKASSALNQFTLLDYLCHYASDNFKSYQREMKTASNTYQFQLKFDRQAANPNLTKITTAEQIRKAHNADQNQPYEATATRVYQYENDQLKLIEKPSDKSGIADNVYFHLAFRAVDPTHEGYSEGSYARANAKISESRNDYLAARFAHDDKFVDHDNVKNNYFVEPKLSVEYDTSNQNIRKDVVVRGVLSLVANNKATRAHEVLVLSGVTPVERNAIAIMLMMDNSEKFEQQYGLNKKLANANLAKIAWSNLNVFDKKFQEEEFDNKYENSNQTLDSGYIVLDKFIQGDVTDNPYYYSKNLKTHLQFKDDDLPPKLVTMAKQQKTYLDSVENLRRTIAEIKANHVKIEKIIKTQIPQRKQKIEVLNQKITALTTLISTEKTRIDDFKDETQKLRATSELGKLKAKLQARETSLLRSKQKLATSNQTIQTYQQAITQLYSCAQHEVKAIRADEYRSDLLKRHKSRPAIYQKLLRSEEAAVKEATAIDAPTNLEHAQKSALATMQTTVSQLVEARSTKNKARNTGGATVVPVLYAASISRTDSKYVDVPPSSVETMDNDKVESSPVAEQNNDGIDDRPMRPER